jgi:hypothetical protein
VPPGQPPSPPPNNKGFVSCRVKQAKLRGTILERCDCARQERAAIPGPATSLRARSAGSIRWPAADLQPSRGATRLYRPGGSAPWGLAGQEPRAGGNAPSWTHLGFRPAGTRSSWILVPSRNVGERIAVGGSVPVSVSSACGKLHVEAPAGACVEHREDRDTQTVDRALSYRRSPESPGGQRHPASLQGRGRRPFDRGFCRFLQRFESHRIELTRLMKTIRVSIVMTICPSR